MLGPQLAAQAGEAIVADEGLALTCHRPLAVQGQGELHGSRTSS